jgi:hypothetical protein
LEEDKSFLIGALFSRKEQLADKEKKVLPHPNFDPGQQSES